MPHAHDADRFGLNAVDDDTGGATHHQFPCALSFPDASFRRKFGQCLNGLNDAVFNIGRRGRTVLGDEAPDFRKIGLGRQRPDDLHARRARAACLSRNRATTST